MHADAAFRKVTSLVAVYDQMAAINGGHLIGQTPPKAGRGPHAYSDFVQKYQSVHS
jgi:hypothetical protein